MASPMLSAQHAVRDSVAWQAKCTQIRQKLVLQRKTGICDLISKKISNDQELIQSDPTKPKGK